METRTPSDRLRAALIPGAITLVALFTIFGGVRLARRVLAPAPPPDATPPAIFSRDGSMTDTLRSLPETDIAIPSAQADADNDGLSDALELLYKTDPQNPDTDGDGYDDGTEVANGYDPTIPSPGDKLATKERGGSEETGAPASPLPPALPSYTEQFLGRTGLPRTYESLLENQNAVARFVDDQNARGFLPTVPDDAIRISPAGGRAAIAAYLDAISIPQNAALVAVDARDITNAFSALTTRGDATPLDAVATNLSKNVEVLQDVSAPSEAADLHRRYLAASIALRDNTNALARYREDYVGALVAASRIEGLRVVFNDVATRIQELEKKYTIL